MEYILQSGLFAMGLCLGILGMQVANYYAYIKPNITEQDWKRAQALLDNQTTTYGNIATPLMGYQLLCKEKDMKKKPVNTALLSGCLSFSSQLTNALYMLPYRFRLTKAERATVDAVRNRADLFSLSQTDMKRIENLLPILDRQIKATRAKRDKIRGWSLADIMTLKPSAVKKDA